MDELMNKRERDEFLNTIRLHPITGRPWYWILDGKTPKAATLQEWSDFIECIDKKRIQQNVYQRHGKRIWISTVFLGIDHAFDEGRPILFETMVFEGHSFQDLYCERYATYDEAIEGHERMFYMAKIEHLGVKPTFT